MKSTLTLVLFFVLLQVPSLASQAGVERYRASDDSARASAPSTVELYDIRALGLGRKNDSGLLPILPASLGAPGYLAKSLL